MRVSWLVAFAPLLAVACGGAASPSPQPQVAIQSSGARYAPLPPRAEVKLYKRRREPQTSFREVGRVTASCPVKYWEGGREVRGGPVCLEGLKQGARKLGGQAVIHIRVKRTRPSWEPQRPWYVMRGHVVRLIH